MKWKFDVKLTTDYVVDLDKAFDETLAESARSMVDGLDGSEGHEWLTSDLAEGGGWEVVGLTGELDDDDLARLGDVPRTLRWHLHLQHHYATLHGDGEWRCWDYGNHPEGCPEFAGRTWRHKADMVAEIVETVTGWVAAR